MKPQVLVIPFLGLAAADGIIELFYNTNFDIGQGFQQFIVSGDDAAHGKCYSSEIDPKLNDNIHSVLITDDLHCVLWANTRPHRHYGSSTSPTHFRRLDPGRGLQDTEEVRDILVLARSLGTKEIDTAARYPATNMGLSEKLLGEFQAIPQGFAVDTKILVLSKDANGTLEPEKIRTSLENSRKSLQLDSSQKLSILHCHAPDYTTPIQDQASALNELHKQGLFDKLGVSNWPLDMLNNFLEVCEREGYVKPTVYQGNYNLIARGHETLMPTLQKHGIRFDAYSPVAGGMLSGKLTAGNIEGTRFAKDNMIGMLSKMQYDKPELHAAVRYLEELLEPAKMTPIEAALRWICYHSMLGSDDSIILGASKSRYLTSNEEVIQKGPLPEDIAVGMGKIWDMVSGN
ncbi:hypothetical protein PG994_012493 [Apiospora phragmitis]|uniref:NADP-dependent oxidoreductase domain-containing protein n=1 Tax=Apiospora phragmitis TaxID=2905665 RepID=A0ABR1TYI0_9PEZI